ncbi:hypothetical protein TNCV_455371 [Trichonephila clavipes]|nr:hypothetical protein TNCV_455371 [Trichonephila clavipes]
MSSSPVPLKTRREGERCMLNLSRARTSSRWCGVVVRRSVASRPRHLTMDRAKPSARGSSTVLPVAALSSTPNGQFKTMTACLELSEFLSLSYTVRVAWTSSPPAEIQQRPIVTTLYRKEASSNTPFVLGSPRTYGTKTTWIESDVDESGQRHTFSENVTRQNSLQGVNTRPSCSGDQTCRSIVPTHQWSRTTVMRAGCKCVTPANERASSNLNAGHEIKRNLNINLLPPSLNGPLTKTNTPPILEQMSMSTSEWPPNVHDVNVKTNLTYISSVILDLFFPLDHIHVTTISRGPQRHDPAARKDSADGRLSIAASLLDSNSPPVDYESLNLPSIVVSDADCCAVGPGFNPGEGMDVCKCIVPLCHGSTLKSRKSSREVGGKGREVGGPSLPRVFSLKIGVEPSQKYTVTCMVLKATDNGRPFAAINFVGLDLTSSDTRGWH